MFDIIWALLYLIAPSISICFANGSAFLALAVLCGYGALVTYILNAVWIIKSLRTGEYAEIAEDFEVTPEPRNPYQSIN